MPVQCVITKGAFVGIVVSNSTMISMALMWFLCVGNAGERRVYLAFLMVAQKWPHNVLTLEAIKLIDDYESHCSSKHFFTDNFFLLKLCFVVLALVSSREQVETF